MPEIHQEHYSSDIPIYGGIDTLSKIAPHWSKISFFVNDLWKIDEAYNDPTVVLRLMRANTHDGAREVVQYLPRKGRFLTLYRDSRTKQILWENNFLVKRFKSRTSKPHEIAVFIAPGELSLFQEKCIPSIIDRGYALAKGRALPIPMEPWSDDRFHSHSFFFRNTELIRDHPPKQLPLPDPKYEIGLSIRNVEGNLADYLRSWYSKFSSRFQPLQIAQDSNSDTRE